jgi:hypothetical protein
MLSPTQQSCALVAAHTVLFAAGGCASGFLANRLDTFTENPKKNLMLDFFFQFCFLRRLVLPLPGCYFLLMRKFGAPPVSALPEPLEQSNVLSSRSTNMDIYLVPALCTP